MTEHSINRSGTTANSDDDHDESTDGDDGDDDERRTEAEIKRELRKGPLGRAILRRNRRLRERQKRRR